MSSLNNDELYRQYLTGQITWDDYLTAKEKVEFNPNFEQLTATVDEQHESREDVKAAYNIRKLQKKITSLSAVTTINFTMVILMAWLLFLQPFVAQLSPPTVAPLAPFSSPDVEPIVPANPSGEGIPEPESIDPISQDLMTQPSDPVALSDYVLPAVFNIVCRPGGLYYTTGSGWALTVFNNTAGRNETVIVTNHHVVNECLTQGEIVALNDTYGEISTELYTSEGGYWLGGSVNSLRDLAVLKITNGKSVDGLPMQREFPTVGQWVMVAGYPGDPERQTVTRVVSFGGVEEIQSSSSMIVTNAQVKQGNSGGPIFNSRGEVLGTIFALTEDTQLGLAQPLMYHCTVVFECFDEKITIQDGMPVLYEMLEEGECLGPTVGSQYNYINMDCGNSQAVLEITYKAPQGTAMENAPDCFLTTGVYETVKGVERLYCSKKINKKQFSDEP